MPMRDAACVATRVCAEVATKKVYTTTATTMCSIGTSYGSGGSGGSSSIINSARRAIVGSRETKQRYSKAAADVEDERQCWVGKELPPRRQHRWWAAAAVAALALVLCC